MKTLIALALLTLSGCYSYGLNPKAYSTFEAAEKSAKYMKPGDWKVVGPRQGFDGTENVYFLKTKVIVD